MAEKAQIRKSFVKQKAYILLLILLKTLKVAFI